MQDSYQSNLPEAVEPGAIMVQSAAPTALAHVEQSRAVAEVQAQLVLARANPRNEALVERKIMNACKRPSLAQVAQYRYKRGGSAVEGPSIRLAEVLVRHWGNTNYGFREIGRGEGFSEVEAFCHDLETNTKVTRTFQVLHTRDKRTGNVALTQERDKYEMVASMAQRRVRACILEIIPGDIVDAAVEACAAALAGSIGNVEEKAQQILVAFSQLDPPVSQEEIEAYLQRSIKSIVAVDVIGLTKVYTSLRDGIAPKAEFFKPVVDERTGKTADFSERFAGQDAPIEQDITEEDQL